MKATEFMIGDWVLYGRRFAIIKELYNGYVTILCSNNGQNEYVEETYDNIKPIPLTETMLIKHFPDTSILTWRPVDYPDKAFVIDYTEEGIDANDIIITIEYVHELQHVLKLCGIEKEIEL